MKIAITAQLRNGLLFEAVKKCGSQAALADYLGVRIGLINRWLNFKEAPNLLTTRKGWQERYEQMDAAFVALIGHGLDEIFPEELKLNEAALRDRSRIEAVKEMPVEMLIGSGAIGQLTAGPEESLINIELKEQIDAALHSLTPREEKVIKMRFGLDGDGEKTYERVGEVFHITRERIRQIEAKALRKLRHPSRKKNLEPFVVR